MWPASPPPSLSSQVNSMDLKKTFWIPPGLRWEQSTNMAGWLCTVGEGDILIHVCISACAVLHIHSMNLLLTSRQTSDESHRGAEHQHIPITHCLICSFTVLHLIFNSMCCLCICVGYTYLCGGPAAAFLNMNWWRVCKQCDTVVKSIHFLCFIQDFQIRSTECPWTLLCMFFAINQYTFVP